MATASSSVAPVMEEPLITKAQNAFDSPELQALCAALHMDPNPANRLQNPDINFLQEMARLPLNFGDVPAGTDVPAMRHWINDVYLKGPFAEYRATCDIPRRRPVTKVDRKDIFVQCSDGSKDSFRICLYEPRPDETELDSQSRPAILMFHGGGWIHGEPSCDERIIEIFASELRAVIFGIDYRLAPEYQFPAPLDDCADALEWVIREASSYRVDPNRIALWGGSAGGNLAAALALRYSQAQSLTNGPELRLVSLVVPAIAHPKAQALFEGQRLFKKSRNEEAFAGAPPLPEEMTKEFENLYELYLGNGTDVCNPYASPLMAHPDSQHPPTHITVAACDPLWCQGLAYAELLRSSGVQVAEDILPGVPHGFTFAMNSDVTRRWLQGQRDIFRAAFDLKGA